MSSAALMPAEDDLSTRQKVKKAPSAFRTISEVADDLHIPQHVLRFWETKFAQVKPLKRGGGRRYYRPEDIALLRRIANLLYTQGYTIKGVQRLLREGGGRLADDIPPPPAEEHEVEAEVTELPLLAEIDTPAPIPLPTARLPLRFVPRSATALAPIPLHGRRLEGSDPVEHSADQSAQREELARLKRVVAETLGQLEAIKALLAKS
jgi:DNA-binding transcriptional MerR regulator